MKTKSSSEILDEYIKLSNAKKVGILYTALEYMQQYNGRTTLLCIAMAMGYEQESLNTYIKVK